MDTKLKSNKRFSLLAVFLLAAAAAALFLSMYGIFEKRAAYNKRSTLNDESVISQFINSNYVLYKDVLEKGRQDKYSYSDLYLDIEQKEINGREDYDRILSEEMYTETMDGPDAIIDAKMNLESRIESYRWELYNRIGMAVDFCVIDHESGQIIKNTGRAPEDQEALNAVGNEDSYVYYVKMVYDEAGNPTVSVRDNDADSLLKTVKSVLQSYSGVNGGRDKIVCIEDRENPEELPVVYTVTTKNPVNATFIYALTAGQKEKIVNDFYDDLGVFSNSNYDAYYSSGIDKAYGMFLLALAAAALLLPCLKKYRFYEYRIVNLPLEIMWIGGFALLGGGMEAVFNMLRNTFDGYYFNQVTEFLYPFKVNAQIMNAVIYGWNFVWVAVLFLLWYICISSLLQIRTKGFKNYLKNSLVYYIYAFVKRLYKKYAGAVGKKWQSFKQEILNTDISQDVNKSIIKIVILNFIVLVIICSIWFFGIAVLVLYSAALYLVIRKYLDKVQSQYMELLKATDSIAQGNLNTQLNEEMGMFEAYKSKLAQIQEGFRKAVDEEVKSQKMKTELITNVSHDLKTPLTAIITYIDLLKGDNVTEEQKKEYLDTLDRKSLRLKALIEDLFEVSKADSRNVTLNFVQVDLANLMRQVYLEHEDQAAGARLEFKFRFPEEKIILELDSQKTYRIFENLYINAIKYAMPGTRVYVNVRKENGAVIVEIKNISGAELDIDPDKLTERFVRGDSSRNTEGSGLGLAIAESFVELQGGNMDISIDGDLFKVCIIWKLS